MAQASQNKRERERRQTQRAQNQALPEFADSLSSFGAFGKHVESPAVPGPT